MSIAIWDFAAYLNARNIPGVRFVPITFTPTSAVYPNQLCGGVNLVLTDRELLDSPEMGVELASALHTLYPQWQMDKMGDLFVNQEAFAALKQNTDPRRIAEQYRDQLEAFRNLRAKYLLY